MNVFAGWKKGDLQLVCHVSSQRWSLTGYSCSTTLERRWRCSRTRLSIDSPRCFCVIVHSVRQSLTSSCSEWTTDVFPNIAKWLAALTYLLTALQRTSFDARNILHASVLSCRRSLPPCDAGLATEHGSSKCPLPRPQTLLPSGSYWIRRMQRESSTLAPRPINRQPASHFASFGVRKRNCVAFKMGASPKAWSGTWLDRRRPL